MCILENMEKLPLFKPQFKIEHYKIIPLILGKNNTRNIYLGYECLYELGALLKEYKVGHRVFIVTNTSIKSLFGQILLGSCEQEGFSVELMDIPVGEQFKHLEIVERIINSLIAFRLERNDTLIALGGGVVGDIGGFAASIYLRGINFVQVPTTLLAQVDASIGGKTGVNHIRGKNLIGSFYQPRFTFIDLKTLETLPQQELRCGLAEVVKYGFIRNKQLFCYLENNLSKIKEGSRYTQNTKIWQYLVYRSAHNKVLVVAKDEKERHLREILNFGHTMGHALEAATHYKKYLHGEAVAIGMKAAFMISYKMKLIPKKLLNRASKVLEGLGFVLEIQGIATDKIIEMLYSDKKIKDNKLRFVLPVKLGKVEVRDNVPINTIKAVLEELMVHDWQAESH